MSLLYEHTFKITVYDLGIEIRCWVQADGHEEKTSGYYAKAVLREVNEHKAKLKELDIAVRRTEIATLVTKAIPEMNAIEVVSIESRHGVVVYKDWFRPLSSSALEFNWEEFRGKAMRAIITFILALLLLSYHVLFTQRVM